MAKTIKKQQNLKNIKKTENNVILNYFRSVWNTIKKFHNKNFYLSFLLDVIFLFVVSQIGNLSDIFSSKIVSFSSAVFAILLIFGALILIYVITKYFFFKLINYKIGFLEILWKHSLVALIIGIIILFLAFFPNWLIRIIALEQSQSALRVYLVIFLSILAYFIFINYQKYTNEKFWFGFKSGLKNIKNNILPIFFADLVILFIGYLLSNIFYFILRLILLIFKIYSPYLLQFYASLNFFIIFLIVALWLTVNKFIIFKNEG